MSGWVYLLSVRDVYMGGAFICKDPGKKKRKEEYWTNVKLRYVSRPLPRASLPDDLREPFTTAPEKRYTP